LVRSLRDLTPIAPNWHCIRERVSDIKHTEFMYDDSYLEVTDDKLSKALEGALQMNDDTSSSEIETEVLPSSEKQCFDVNEEKKKRDGSSSWLAFKMTR
jgi:hypothetical protein